MTRTADNAGTSQASNMGSRGGGSRRITNEPRKRSIQGRPAAAPVAAGYRSRLQAPKILPGYPVLRRGIVV